MQKDQCFKQIKKCIDKSTLNLYIQQMLADNQHHIGFFYFCLMMIAYRCGYPFEDFPDKRNSACRGLLNLDLLEQDYYYDSYNIRTHMCHLSDLCDLYFKSLPLDRFFESHIDKSDIRMLQMVSPEKSRYNDLRLLIETKLTSGLYHLYRYVLEHTNLLRRNHLIEFLIQHHVHLDIASVGFLKYVLCYRYQNSESVDPFLLMSEGPTC